MRLAASARSLLARTHRQHTGALRRSLAAHAASGMNETERYFFDLNGYIVVPQARRLVAPPQRRPPPAAQPDGCFCAGARCSVRRRWRRATPPSTSAAASSRHAPASAPKLLAHGSRLAQERTGALRLGGQPGAPLAGNGRTGRDDLGGILGWRDVEGADGGPFRAMLAHPKLLPYYNALCGRGYRLDHSPFVLQQRSGAEGFELHGGAVNEAGGTDYELAYSVGVDGAQRCALLAASLQLVDTAPGDGGFVLLRGSHKARFPVPPSVKGFFAGAEHGATPAVKAGDVLLFTEAATHGTLPWLREDTRRLALYRFTPSSQSYGRGYLRESSAGEVGPATRAWPQAYREGLSPAQLAVLEPPYHVRLDRPAPAADGVATTVPEPRAAFKKAYDESVFGTTYF